MRLWPCLFKAQQVIVGPLFCFSSFLLTSFDSSFEKFEKILLNFLKRKNMIESNKEGINLSSYYLLYRTRLQQSCEKDPQCSYKETFYFWANLKTRQKCKVRLHWFHLDKTYSLSSVFLIAKKYLFSKSKVA